MTDNLGFAPAKVNLALHVTGQRADGYHLLDSLVVFADVGDTIFVEPSDDLSLKITGARTEGVPADQTNLVMKAAQLLGPRGAAITLHKILPSGGGIGGGSSDAAATLRVLSQLWQCPIPSDVAALGADIPVCLKPGTQRMQGIGELISEGPSLPSLPAVLVNPGIHVPTPAIFGRLAEKVNPPMPDTLPDCSTVDAVVDFLSGTRNDLRHPAVEAAPEIESVLHAIEASGASFTQMSGSGSTCFGLYETLEQAQRAAGQIRRAGADWWVMPTTLNP